MNFNELWKKTKATQSKIEKEHIIKEFFETADDIELKLLKCYLDPDFVVNFSKGMISKSKNNMIHSISSTYPSVDLYDTLILLADHKLVGSVAVKHMSAKFSTWNKELIESFEMIATKASLGFSLSSINDVYMQLYGKKFLEVFECQLAESYDVEKISKYKNKFWASVKLDGLRSLFYSNNFHTRNNKTVTGFEFLRLEAQKVSDHFNLNLLDGEFYSEEIPFEEIQGAVMRTVNIDEIEKQKIIYNVFAALNDDILKSNTSVMIDKLIDIKQYCIQENLKHIVVLDQELIDNDKKLIADKCQEFMYRGYEGIMLRDIDIPYDFKRSRALLKYKVFQEDDFLCIDITEGEGDLVGKMGAVIVESKSGNVRSKVGTGFSDKQRVEIFNNPDIIIGKMVEVKFQGYTESSLRFPVFRKIKEDR